MSLIRKISQLKKSDDLMPDKTWETTTKHNLLSEIASQNRLMQVQELTSNERVDFFVMRFLNKVSPSFSKVLAGLIIIMMGSGVSIAAQASVPGQALWPIKRSIEKVEISLTLSPVKETEVHIKHAKERSEEIIKIFDKDASTPEKKDKKQKAIKQAALHLEKDIAAADSSLKIVKEEKTPVEIVELAKKVTDATKEVSQALDQKSTEAQDEYIDKTLDNAKQVNEGVKRSAVNVALEVHEEAVELAKQKAENNIDITATENQIDESGIHTDDQNMDFDTSTTESMIKRDSGAVVDKDLETITNLVKEMIASEIDDASSDIEQSKEKVDVKAEEGQLEILKNEKIELETVNVKEELESIGELNDENISSALEEAKALLDEGFLRNAYNRISQVKEQYKHAEDVLKEIEKAIEENKVIDSDIFDQLNKDETPVEENIQPETEIIDNTNTTEVKASMLDTKAEDYEVVLDKESVLEQN